MEHDKPAIYYFETELTRVFGPGADTLKAQIAHDNPSLASDDVIHYAWSLIPEAAAFMQPSSQEDLTANAINIHENYEAHRRIAD